MKTFKEEHQQGLRSKNFIVFRVEEREDGDENFVEQIINDVGEIANVKFVKRIGDQSKKARPINKSSLIILTRGIWG